MNHWEFLKISLQVKRSFYEKLIKEMRSTQYRQVIEAKIEAFDECINVIIRAERDFELLKSDSQSTP